MLEAFINKARVPGIVFPQPFGKEVADWYERESPEIYLCLAVIILLLKKVSDLQAEIARK